MSPIRMTKDQIDEHQARIHGKHKNNHSGSSANMEQRAGYATERPDAAKKAMPPVVIRFTHYRRKPADMDNFATKWFIDALVKNGILRDDTPEEVTEVRHRQVKIEMWEKEKIELDLIYE